MFSHAPLGAALTQGNPFSPVGSYSGRGVGSGCTNCTFAVPRFSISMIREFSSSVTVSGRDGSIQNFGCIRQSAKVHRLIVYPCTTPLISRANAPCNSVVVWSLKSPLPTAALTVPYPHRPPSPS
jgi:hypothetical protein